jgi:enamine deaminase RidA (YjgF/YER057c/UK114 family)
MTKPKFTSSLEALSNASIEEVPMPKQVLTPPNLSFQPRPAYPYSPGTRGGRLVYTAGQVAWNEQGELVGLGDPAAQTRQVLSNVESIVRECGATAADVLECNVYLADIRHFEAMNEVSPASSRRTLPLARPSRRLSPSPRCWSRSRRSLTWRTESGS